MEKVKIPQENGGNFSLPKIILRSYGRKNSDRINNPIVFSWDN
jgi:hypothetical protein